MVDLVKFQGNSGNRLPPQNIEAEESILGAILLDPEAISKVANEIVASPAFRSWVESRGSTPGAVMNISQAAAFDKAESERYTKVAADVGLERE